MVKSTTYEAPHIVLQAPVTCFLIGLNILLRILFPNILKLIFSLRVTDYIPHS